MWGGTAAAASAARRVESAGSVVRIRPQSSDTRAVASSFDESCPDVINCAIFSSWCGVGDFGLEISFGVSGLRFGISGLSAR